MHYASNDILLNNMSINQQINGIPTWNLIAGEKEERMDPAKKRSDRCHSQNLIAEIRVDRSHRAANAQIF